MNILDNIRFIARRTSVVLLFCFASVAVAENDAGLTSSLNQAMERVTEISDEITVLNPDILALSFQLMQQDPSVDSLKAAGDNIVYPSNLKKDYDSAIDQVYSSADRLFENVRTNSSPLACKNRMVELQAKLEAIKSTVMSTRGLSVLEAESRAKAYLGTMNNVPLALLVSQVVLSDLTVCA